MDYHHTNSPVTQLLQSWRAGNEQALNQLMPMVYNTLRQLAARYMRRESEGHTLQATVVVNEAYLRLADANADWQDRSHFLALAARAMRNILIDHARSKQRQKRGGEFTRITLHEADVADARSHADLLDLDDALNKLAEVDSRKARVIELHFFGGLTYDEIARVAEISAATVDRELRFAKAWLCKHLRDETLQPA